MSYNRTFRVFVSSTFEDFQQERELLRSRVWPELENFCKLRGAAFEAIDLRWGIPANSAEDLDIVTICLDEVERCRNLSPRPNFIAMLGNRYGWRPLPATIPIDLYDTLPGKTRGLIGDHYSLDLNAVPAVYLVNKKKLGTSKDENALLTEIRNSLNEIKRTTEQENHFFKSATHLEIDKGIFRPENEDKNMEDHFFCCFRSIEELSGEVDASKISASARSFIDVKDAGGLQHDPDAKAWLDRLGAEISGKLKNNKDQIGNYQTTLDELSGNEILPYMHNMCRDIEKWLKKVIVEELDELDGKDALEIEKIEHEKFKVQRNATFGGRNGLRSELKNDFNNQRDTNVICIHGDGGSGKSALMSKIIDDAGNEFTGSTIVYRFIGATPNSVELNRLLEGIVAEVTKQSELTRGIAGITREEHVDAFRNCMASSFSNNRVFIFIDALDQLNNTENAHSLYWLPQKFSENVTLVLSVLNGSVQEAVQKIYPGAKFIDLSPHCRTPEPGEAEAMLNALLQKKPARTLQQDQKNYILENFNKNPLLLYLKLVVENARHWHSYDSIETIKKKNIGIKETVDQQIKSLFDRLSQKENYGREFVKRVRSLIVLSREGVSEAEIKCVLWRDDVYKKEFDQRQHHNQLTLDSLPPIIWSRFFFEIEPFIMERAAGGAIVFDFFHRRFKDVLKADIPTKLASTIHGLLVSYFSDKKLNPIRFIDQDGSFVYNTRKLIELPYHQVSAGWINDSYETLTDFVFIESKVKIGRAYELMEDFEQIVRRDTKREFPLIHLIAKALRADINFIARHPDCLFQSLYNSCWWYDHPDGKDYYSDDSKLKHPAPGKPDNKLYALMESWRNTKGALDPGFRWLRSLKPPSVPLDGPQQSVLKGLSSPVVFVRYSPRDDKIYALCNLGEFIVWDAVSQNIEQFNRIPIERSFMFKPNSKFTFTDQTERLNDDGGVIADHPGFEYWAWPGIISQDGQSVLGGSIDGTVTLWKFSSRKNEEIPLEVTEKNRFEKQLLVRPVRGMAFSDDNKMAATGHADGTLFIWDLQTNKSIASFKHKAGWVNSVAMSGNGGTVVSGGGDDCLYVWKRDKNPAGQYSPRELKGHSDRIWCVAISGDGKFAASGSDDKSVRLWDLHNNKELKCLIGHSRWVQAVAFNKNGNLLASSGGDGKIMFWEVNGDNREPVRQYEGHDDSVLSLHFSNDGKTLLSGSRDHSVRIWDIDSKYTDIQIEGHRDRIRCMCFSGDGLTLITGSDDKTVRLWHADSGKPVTGELEIGTPVSALQVSPDNNSIWVGGDDGSIDVWSLVDHTRIRRIDAHASRIYALDISRDSKMAASGSQDGSSEDSILKLWRFRTFENIRELPINNESILSLAFSVDGSKLTAGMRSGMIILWEISDHDGGTFKLKEICRKKVFEKWVEEIIFSKDGNKIEARGGGWKDRHIRILDGNTLAVINTGEEKIQDGAVGSFGQYRLGIGSAELSVKDHCNQEEIAWFPRALEFAVIHPKNRQWEGVQRYNLHHFRLEGGA